MIDRATWTARLRRRQHPTDWFAHRCPVTHFGYLESGSMGIKFKDDPDNIKIIKVGRPCGNQIMSRRFSPMPEA